MRRFNDWLALRLSAAFSTMACFYAFLVLSLLPLVWHNSMEVVQFISSGVLQLVALPLLAVAAKVINDKADQHGKEIAALHEKHDRLHRHLNGGIDNGEARHQPGVLAMRALRRSGVRVHGGPVLPPGTGDADRSVLRADGGGDVPVGASGRGTMIGNFPPCLSFTLAQEGGWADNPSDPGGCTMRGVTLRTYADWCARNGLAEPTPDDLRAIPDSQLSVIYHSGYWRPIAGDELPRGVDLMVFDFGVNAGTGTSARLLQRAVGVAEDGDIGPITLAAVRAQRPAALIEALAVAQDAHYTGLPGFAEFGGGWLARTTRRRAAALGMVA